MRIHVNALIRSEIEGFVPAGLSATITEHRSQSHRTAFEVSMAAPEGFDNDGNKRTQAPYHGGTDEFPRAATWVEWGDFIVKIFEKDPEAMVHRIYKDSHEFVNRTQRAAPHRAEPSAEEAANRWSFLLYYARQKREQAERQAATA